MGIEREYKYLLTAASRRILLGRLEAAASILQQNIFYDDAGQLITAGWALRLRFEADVGLQMREVPPYRRVAEWSRATLALKGRAERAGALFRRQEHECSLPLAAASELRSGGWRTDDLPAMPLREALRELAGNGMFQVIGAFRNLRCSGDIAGVHAEIDWSETPDGRERFELELETGGDLPRQLLEMLEASGAQPAAAGKFAWLMRRE